MTENNPSLKRSLGLWHLIFYGCGTMIGAGIYVLIGKVAGIAGDFAPFSFLVAGITALFTALSYGELTSLYPKSAGEVEYVDQAFKFPPLSLITGILILFTGIVSTSVIILGFLGYLSVFITLPPSLVTALVVIILCGISIWGIGESISLLSIITIIEIAGILVVVLMAIPQITESQNPLSIHSGNWEEIDLRGIYSGAFLAFFAFIGFEDLANVAEECRNPKRDIPLAILISLLVSTVLYFILAWVAISIVPLSELENSSSPLETIVSKISGNLGGVISIIGMVAIINGALAQIIMSSRVVYGMSEKKYLPAFLGKISPRYRTPIVATVSIGLIIWVLTISFNIVALAEWTSLIICILFTLVNAALIRIKLSPLHKTNTRKWTIVIPTIGLVLSLIFVFTKFI